MANLGSARKHVDAAMDLLWQAIRREVEQEANAEPLLTSFFTGYAVLTILSLKTGLTANGR